MDSKNVLGKLELEKSLNFYSIVRKTHLPTSKKKQLSPYF